ncbi:sialate O-acetylesterase [uncultured Draconibacterium sp.]|uniref:sialate O-acetylesterase n=1 Tax=uncultured Draconibacterium sp. TaxID=1573823 RepID=UPI0025F43937|nr:sialate O-acetylesterase [uncultured Draconibacterium sp.]
MKKTGSYILLIIIKLLLIQTVNAEIKLPAIVSSNMVLQRNTTIKLWGWADANEKISIKTSWLKNKIKLQTDNDGNWCVEMKTTGSKEPQSIIIKSNTSEIRLDNILFGEVWICSGQSNMEQPLKGYERQPTYGSNMSVAKSFNPNLRLFTVERYASKKLLKEIEKYRPWQEASPNNVLEFSAVAYFFGQQLQEILDVPVGLIHNAWGGSSIQAWMSTDVLSEYQQVDIENLDITKQTNKIPTALFNSMLNPLIPYTIKGILWYQGESNRLEPENYKKLFPAMVGDWRKQWGIGDFPFYYTQIAPYMYGNNEVFNDPNNSAFIRESQLECLELIPNSGIAITMDIGDDYCIHPPKKKEVADRLLFNALNQTYGFKTVDHAAPIYDSKEVKDNGIILKFKYAETGLFSFNGLQGFEIAGEDKVFYPANARIVKNNQVFVQSDNVSNPIEVRYAWRNWVIGTLYDVNLLPASSFRTDNWENASRAK